MITLFVIGLIVFAVKVTLLGIKAAWGITKDICSKSLHPNTRRPSSERQAGDERNGSGGS